MGFTKTLTMKMRKMRIMEVVETSRARIRKSIRMMMTTIAERVKTVITQKIMVILTTFTNWLFIDAQDIMINKKNLSANNKNNSEY